MGLQTCDITKEKFEIETMYKRNSKYYKDIDTYENAEREKAIVINNYFANDTESTDKKTGVYKIENIANGKIYIGESDNIEKRWTTHIEELKNNRHYNRQLQSDFNKYGEENFKFEIVELLFTSKMLSKYTFPLKNKAIIICREHAYINKFNSIETGYNQEKTLDKILAGEKLLIGNIYTFLSGSTDVFEYSKLYLSKLIETQPHIIEFDFKVTSDFLISLNKKNKLLAQI